MTVGAWDAPAGGVLARLEALERAATPVRWQANDCGSRIEISNPVLAVAEIDASYDEPFDREQVKADAALIVEARNVLPALLNIARAMEQIAETARWYANNGERDPHEVDHALCVEVVSVAENALEGLADERA